MADYHLSTKIISRKAGRSSTASAAYRAGEQVVDERTGEIHDYTKKAGVMHSEIIMPEGCNWQPKRAELWNAVEAKNKRNDAQVAREFVVALPHELDDTQRQALALELGHEIANRYNIAVDVALHAPSATGDQRNYHAHLMTSTNTVTGQGFGNKDRSLDAVAHTMNKSTHGTTNQVELLRELWANMQNRHLEAAGCDARVDHRTLVAQGIERAPTVHLGPTATAIERRTGKNSRRRDSWEEQAAITARLVTAQQEGASLDRCVIDLSGDLTAALAVRDRLFQECERQQFQARNRVLLNMLANATEQAREQSDKARIVEQLARSREEEHARDLEKVRKAGFSKAAVVDYLTAYPQMTERMRLEYVHRPLDGVAAKSIATEDRRIEGLREQMASLREECREAEVKLLVLLPVLAEREQQPRIMKIFDGQLRELQAQVEVATKRIVAIDAEYERINGNLVWAERQLSTDKRMCLDTAISQRELEFPVIVEQAAAEAGRELKRMVDAATATQERIARAQAQQPDQEPDEGSDPTPTFRPRR